LPKSFKSQHTLIILGIPLLSIALLILLTNSSYFSTHSDTLSSAVTIDLLITIPLIYFLSIRKTALPKTTVVPFIILGVIVCSLILPLENQYYLNRFKTWFLPVIELVVIAFVIYNIVKARQLYKIEQQNVSSDFFTVLKTTCYKILPKAVVIPFVTEVAVFYYGFIHWKKRKLKPNEFSYHKDSGTISLLIAILFLIVIETGVFHILLAKWNTTAAWILTGISAYSGIQILGFLKSMLKRPIVIANDILYLRYGIMNETTVRIKDIDSIELYSKDLELNKTTRKLSFLGNLEGHNIIIKLKNEQTLIGLYGTKTSYKVLALHVDKKQDFKDRIIAVSGNVQS
jgi:hypothetical protein